MNRILIAGTNSGCGKTTIACAILKALINKNLIVQPYKCGPDYIDTMFHTHITNRISRNLDTYMLDEITIKYLLNKNSKGVDISIIEGVMGYYDGIGTDGLCSTYDLAKIIQAPVILVVNSKGMGTSIAALINGFVKFKSLNNIKGVILNGIHNGYYQLQKEAIEKYTGVEVLGYMPYIEDVNLNSRHLGLIKADEVYNLNLKIEILANQALKTIDLNRLIEISKQVPKLQNHDFNLKKIYDFKIGVARDKAFCFYYQDNLDLLEQLGANIIYFSPIDDNLPNNLDALYFGGGYPEIYADLLEKNIHIRKAIYNKIKSGIPTIAECGGFMYLCNKINSYNMVGILDGEVNMQQKLVRFGYCNLVSLNDNILAKANWSIKGHEFHYSDSTINGNNFKIIKSSGKVYYGINAFNNLFAGYPHIHFWSNIDFVIRFINHISNPIYN